jgi:hypothetical protein
MTWDRSQLEAILAPPGSVERQLVAADLALEHGEELTSLALRIAARHPGQIVFLRPPGAQNPYLWINTGALVFASWNHQARSVYWSSLRGQWMNGLGETNLPWLTDALKAEVLQYLRNYYQASGPKL